MTPTQTRVRKLAMCNSVNVPYRPALRINQVLSFSHRQLLMPASSRQINGTFTFSCRRSVWSGIPPSSRPMDLHRLDRSRGGIPPDKVRNDWHLDKKDGRVGKRTQQLFEI